MGTCLLPASDPASQKTTPGWESKGSCPTSSQAQGCKAKLEAVPGSYAQSKYQGFAQPDAGGTTPQPSDHPQRWGSPWVPPSPLPGEHPATERMQCPPPPSMLPDGWDKPLQELLAPRSQPPSRSLLLSPGPVPAHGTAAAQPHLGPIFHAKPHSPLGRRSRSGKSRGSQGNSPKAGAGCGRLTWRKVELEGQRGSAAGWGQRQEKPPPPHRLPRPRQEQSLRGPGDRITPSWKHVLPRAQALHDLTTTCLQQGRKRGNLSFFLFFKE